MNSIINIKRPPVHLAAVTPSMLTWNQPVSSCTVPSRVAFVETGPKLHHRGQRSNIILQDSLRPVFPDMNIRLNPFHEMSKVKPFASCCLLHSSESTQFRPQSKTLP